MTRKQKMPERAAEIASVAEAMVLLQRLKSTVKQQKIAEETGVNQGQVSRLLRGKFKKPQGNALALCKYAKGLGLDTSDVPARGTKNVALPSWLSEIGGGSPEGAKLGMDVLAAVEALVAYRCGSEKA